MVISTDFGKRLIFAVLVVLALFGGWQGLSGARNLYGDWQFVRALRIQYLQRQAQARARQTAPATPVAAPSAEPAK